MDAEDEIGKEALESVEESVGILYGWPDNGIFGGGINVIANSWSFNDFP